MAVRGAEGIGWIQAGKKVSRMCWATFWTAWCQSACVGDEKISNFYNCGKPARNTLFLAFDC